MKLLAIESSCDETAAAVVQNGRQVLSSLIASQVEEHKLYGGVVPEIASRRHVEAVAGLARQALDAAGCDWADLNGIAVTAWPGLIGALLVGVNFAKGAALATGLPLIPVHHLRAHVAANYLCHPDLTPPFLCLVVSGGHTHLVAVDDYTRYRVIGRTRDDAAGECFDKTARAMGMPYPGGVHLDAAAEAGDPAAYALPHPKVENCPWDFSFSGLKTYVINLIHRCEQKGEAFSVPDLAASVRHHIVAILTQKTLAAAEAFGYQTVVLAGGVSANRLLRRRMEEACCQAGRRLFVPDIALCGDNAAMVGAQGYYEALAGHFAGQDLNAAATKDIEQG